MVAATYSWYYVLHKHFLFDTLIYELIVCANLWLDNKKKTPTWTAYLTPFNVIIIGVPEEKYCIIWDYLPFYQ
jgi:hypothetical protein